MILASVLTNNLAILVLAGFVGFIVISKIPNTLHTPLMSGTNAVHGIVLLGALIALGFGGLDGLSKGLLVIAVAFGTINIVGGFLVTDRMLDMFKSKPAAAEPAAPAPKSAGSAVSPKSADSPAAAEPAPEPTPNADAPDAATQEQPQPGAAGPAPSLPEASTPAPEADAPPEPEPGEQA